MQKILSVVVVFFLSLYASVAKAEKSVWQGIHLSYGVSTQTGNHDFVLSHEWWGDHEVWGFPLSGEGSVLEFGYRWQVGESRFTIGPTFSLMQGMLSGGRQWQHTDTGVSAQLGYQSEIQATAGIELGHIASERLLFTVEGGVVASDACLSLSGSFRNYNAGTALTGYIPGHYIAAGIDYRFENGTTLGLEVGRYNFEYSDSWGEVTGILSTDVTVISLEVGWQF